MANSDFREVMARVPTGVVIVSAGTAQLPSRDPIARPQGLDAPGFRGLTASSLVSISVDPPMVVVGLDRDTATRAAVLRGRAFNVNVLTRSQEFLADRFAGRAPAVDGAWKDVPHRLGANDLPLIEGCAAWLECRLVEVHPVGDHDLCVGEVVDAVAGAGDPLVLWDRAFWTLR